MIEPGSQPPWEEAGQDRGLYRIIVPLTIYHIDTSHQWYSITQRSQTVAKRRSWIPWGDGPLPWAGALAKSGVIPAPLILGGQGIPPGVLVAMADRRVSNGQYRDERYGECCSS